MPIVKAKHIATDPSANYTFQELEKIATGSSKSLDVAEEDWIRAGGGPRYYPNGTPRSLPAGTINTTRLQNERVQMSDARYTAGGGTIPYP